MNEAQLITSGETFAASCGAYYTKRTVVPNPPPKGNPERETISTRFNNHTRKNEKLSRGKQKL
eukprot:971725-Ditylum_brightwellii.AAC.1